MLTGIIVMGQLFQRKTMSSCIWNHIHPICINDCLLVVMFVWASGSYISTVTYRHTWHCQYPLNKAWIQIDKNKHSAHPLFLSLSLSLSPYIAPLLDCVSEGICASMSCQQATFNVFSVCVRYCQAVALTCFSPCPRACTSNQPMMAYMSSQALRREWVDFFKKFQYNISSHYDTHGQAVVHVIIKTIVCFATCNPKAFSLSPLPVASWPL